MANPTLTPLVMSTQLRTIGRASVFYTTGGAWDGVTDIVLTPLADTEGDIELAANEEYSDLMLPELTGPAKHERYYAGEDPVLSIPFFLADPAKRIIISPAGSKHAGYDRRRSVTETTLVLFPEELFYDSATDAYKVLAYTGGGAWTVNGNALTTDQETLLQHSMWLWRGHFSRPPLTFKHADAGKAVDVATFQTMQAGAGSIDGQRLYTVGDPYDAGVYINPVSS